MLTTSSSVSLRSYSLFTLFLQLVFIKFCNIITNLKSHTRPEIIQIDIVTIRIRYHVSGVYFTTGTMKMPELNRFILMVFSVMQNHNLRHARKKTTFHFTSETYRIYNPIIGLRTKYTNNKINTKCHHFCIIFYTGSCIIWNNNSRTFGDVIFLNKRITSWVPCLDRTILQSWVRLRGARVRNTMYMLSKL